MNNGASNLPTSPTEESPLQGDDPEMVVPTPPGTGEPQELAEPDEPAVPPALSGRSMLRRGFVRWMLMGGVRVLYRWWTRIAAHAFPEDSRRAALAERVGIPLPDRLNMSWVTADLSVGGRVLLQDIPRLAKSGVSAVVDTRSEHKDDEAALAANGIQLLYLPTPDTYPLTVEQLKQGADWINDQIARGHRVLVHCEHGVGRSVLLTAAALVEQGMSAHQAIALVQRRRWQAAPNHRQMQRLQQFERVARGTVSASPAPHHD